MTRRKIIYYDNTQNKFYVTDEFNGDKEEFERFSKRSDICNIYWSELLEKHFSNVRTLEDFEIANLISQLYYLSFLDTYKREEMLKDIQEVYNYETEETKDAYSALTGLKNYEEIGYDNLKNYLIKEILTEMEGPIDIEKIENFNKLKSLDEVYVIQNGKCIKIPNYLIEEYSNDHTKYLIKKELIIDQKDIEKCCLLNICAEESTGIEYLRYKYPQNYIVSNFLIANHKFFHSGLNDIFIEKYEKIKDFFYSTYDYDNLLTTYYANPDASSQYSIDDVLEEYRKLSNEDFQLHLLIERNTYYDYDEFINVITAEYDNNNFKDLDNIDIQDIVVLKIWGERQTLLHEENISLNKLEYKDKILYTIETEIGEDESEIVLIEKLDIAKSAYYKIRNDYLSNKKEVEEEQNHEM